MFKTLVGLICTFQMIAGLASAVEFAITDKLEQLTVGPIAGGWTTVNFLNSYTTVPIPVCVGEVVSNASWTPVVRIQNVSTSGMQVRVQKFSNAANDVTAPLVNVGNVHCIIAETGTHVLPGAPVGSKVWLQAGKHTVSNTYGFGAAQGWSAAEFPDDVVVADPGLDGAYAGSGLSANLGVLAQIMTSNDPFGQVEYVNDCEGRGNNPFQTNFADGVCIGRHVGRLAQVAGAPDFRAPEDIGYIIFRTGNGEFTNALGGFNFSGGLSTDSVASVDNNPPYSFATGATLDGAVATQQAEDGGDGSYAGLYGPSPLNGANIDLAVDESANLSNRRHTNEFVAWLGFRKLAFPIDVQKAVDIPDTTGFPTINYTMTIENTSLLDIATVNVTDVLTQGATTLSLTTGPTLTDPNSNGILDIGETWTYVATYKISEANYDAGGGSLLNTFEVSGPLLVTQTATATTLIPVNPRMNVIKTSTLLGGAPIPAGGASLGDVIEYTYTVRNNGNVFMTSVVLDDDHLGFGVDPAFVSCTLTQDQQTNGNTNIGTTDFEIQTLAPRDTVACTATYTVVQADIDSLQNP